MEKNSILVDPKLFLKSSRIDLVPKFFYIKNKEELGSNYFEQLYLNHIRAFNSFNENHKRGKEDFLKDFDKVASSIEKNGFRKEFPIPCDKKFSAIDGAHRISSSLFFNKKVYANIIEDGVGPNYNYKYFKKRGLSQWDLEEIIFRYFRMKSSNLYACVFWGSSTGKLNKKEIEKELLKNDIDVVYSKSVDLTETGKKNLIISCYEDESWMNHKKNDFSGAIRKVAPCFKGSNKVRFYLLESDNPKAVLSFKKNLRKKINMGNHSLHTSDTYQETRNLCDLFLNKNSMFFMNHSKNMLLDDLLKDKKLKDKMDFAVTSSYVLETFGIRKAEDIDYIDCGGKKIKGLGGHHSYFSSEEIKELVYNPKNYFRFRGIKFLTLENVLKFKDKRGEGKDKRDRVLIEKFLQDKKVFDYKEKIVVFQIKIISLALKIIKKIPQKTRDRLKNNKLIMGFYKKLFC